jgi:hypothetical protein
MVAVSAVDVPARVGESVAAGLLVLFVKQSRNGKQDWL